MERRPNSVVGTSIWGWLLTVHEKRKRRERGEKGKEMAFWTGGERTDLKKWQIVDARLMQSLFIFYTNDLDIHVAERVLVSSIFKGGFTIEYGGSTSDPSYKNIIQAKLRTQKTSSTALSRDPVLMGWLERLGKDAIRLKMIFGMCPFRMVYDDEIGSDTIVIPDMISGNFIYRLNEFDVLEVGWMSTLRKGKSKADVLPDSDTGVYVWSDSKPVMVGRQPYNSVAARLRKPYLVRERVIDHFLVADQMASKPPIVTQSKENPRSIEHMSYDEILAESVLFGEDDQTVENMERQRIDQSAVSRQAQLGETHGGGGFGFPVYGPKPTGVDMFGLEYEHDAVSPWVNNHYPITSGRTTANISVPKPRGDVDKWNHEWSESVHKAFGVPMDQASSGKKTSAEALASDARFRTSVASGRDAIKSFVEEAWAQSMSASENQAIVEALTSIGKRKQEILGKRKEEDTRTPAERAAIRGDPFLDDSGGTTTPPGGGNPIPSDSSTSGVNPRSDMRGGASSKRRRINIDRKGEDIPVEKEEEEEDPNRLQEVENARRDEAARLQSSSVVLGQEEIERILKIASLRDIEVDPMAVQSEVQETTRSQVRNLDDRVSQLKDTLSQRTRLIWHWDAPLIDVADIIALRNEGLIDEDTARVLTYTHYTLPYDTPGGESKEEKMAAVKQKCDMEREGEKQKGDIAREREKQKGDLAKLKEQNKSRIKAAPPPSGGVPEEAAGGPKQSGRGKGGGGSSRATGGRK